ncbi:hypothetical protein CERZMDRAFT_92333 [Cercospora zeae-maydis SCOH1-5]|uniref:Uncharacterized protein n=1 Tax=Cercospora zeae-maydis SCOH1-5 TaxID=717836 RepID=A0A6A6FWQ2_9PEZI|nr:hypothetical protein CERZMDRAFT_92333 [Cercospora zeae-maydis SCOH1-5]
MSKRMPEHLLPRDLLPTNLRPARQRCPKRTADRPWDFCTNQASLLLSLPGDIRNIIWEFVFERADGMHVDFSVDPTSRRGHRSVFALSMTCRYLYNETRDLPFWLNVVHLHAPVLQDLSVLCSHRYQDSPPTPPFPSRRLVEVPFHGDLASKHVALRQKAQEYVTMAMRIPHVDLVTTRMWMLLSKPDVLRALRKVHVHLGFQTNNVFLDRFYTAWDEASPYLRMLRVHTELRVSFQLRLSRRLVVQYDFRTADAEVMLSDVDRCVVMEGDLTLPEMASVNTVRFQIWHGLFEMTNALNHRLRRHSKESSSSGPCRRLGKRLE